jgi:hypothetical protein
MVSDRLLVQYEAVNGASLWNRKPKVPMNNNIHRDATNFPLDNSNKQKR